MAMFAFLLNNPGMKAAEIEHCFDCNLCRCTGYFPILAAAKSFAPDYEDCFTADRPVSKVHAHLTSGPVDLKLPFPAHLKARRLETTVFRTRLLTVHRPICLADVPVADNVRYFSGATEVSLDRRKTIPTAPETFVFLAAVAELDTITATPTDLTIGGGVTLSDVARWVDTHPTTHQAVTALRSQLRYFASAQVRSVATLAGNMANASPISDVVPVMMASRAVVTIRHPAGRTRTVPATEFVTGYRRTVLEAGELIEKVTIPLDGRQVGAFKLSRRKEDDIASVNAGISFGFDAGVITSPVIALGGLAASTRRAPRTEALLDGKTLTRDLAMAAAAALADEVQLDAGAPGGMVGYRPVAAGGLLFRHLAAVAKTAPEPADFGFTEADLEAAAGLPPRTDATYVYHDVDEADHAEPGVTPGSTHTSQRHLSSVPQVKGTADYVSTMAVPEDVVEVALVTSTRPHATVTAIDTAPALDIPGVVAVLTAADLPAAKVIGLAMKDETLLVGVGDTARYIGHPIAVVAAESMDIARRAVQAVRVTYDDLPHILTIAEARAAESYTIPPKCLDRGDVAAALAAAHTVTEGTIELGGQEHFYLEPQAAVVTPIDGREFVAHVTTQNPNAIHESLAAVLGVRQSDITVRIRRLGGAFGGKESNLLYPDVAGLVAQATGRTARIVLDRDVDMATTGKRHPMTCDYRIGCDASGAIVGLDIAMFVNGGFSLDLSGSVIERACLHADGAYRIPNMRVRGHVCRTNLPSNTAFRGFGAPQAIYCVEQIVESLARQHGADPLAMRRANFYQDGDDTHFAQPLGPVHVTRVWDTLLESSKYATRRQEIDLWNATHRTVKKGLAITPVKFGVSFTQSYLNQAAALVHVYKDGTVLVAHGGIEMGQGVHTKCAQIAADALGVPLSSVHIQETATDKTANVAPTSASTGSDLNGMAVLNAATQIADRLAPYRARFPDAAFRELCVKAWFDRVDLSAHGFYKTPIKGFDFVTQTGEAFAYFTYGGAVAEVELDTLTGEHRVIRADVLFDIGRSINPAIDVGQVEGAFVQAAGWLTTEDFIVLSNGAALSRGPGTYKVPGFGDVPEDFRLSFLRNSDNPRAVRSSKGLGEPPFCLGQVIVFALQDAVASTRPDGWTMLRAPATIETLRMAVPDEVREKCEEAMGVKGESGWRLPVM